MQWPWLLRFSCRRGPSCVGAVQVDAAAGDERDAVRHLLEAAAGRDVVATPAFFAVELDDPPAAVAGLRALVDALSTAGRKAWLSTIVLSRAGCAQLDADRWSWVAGACGIDAAEPPADGLAVLDTRARETWNVPVRFEIDEPAVAPGVALLIHDMRGRSQNKLFKVPEPPHFLQIAKERFEMGRMKSLDLLLPRDSVGRKHLAVLWRDDHWYAQSLCPLELGLGGQHVDEFRLEPGICFTAGDYGMVVLAARPL